MPRKVTTQMLEMIEAGELDRDAVILACANYMSEDDVADMCRSNDFIFDSEDDEDEDEGSEHA